ncbi:DHS-like NAD/FAD-binding domain-containing protein [Cytidiella melzeri]|nr:DHS-like NAD/FAD-binding domain-containing protein [Cytidiella melzeri]
MSLSTDIASFRQALKASKNIIAVAGAGLSAASGIPTFRSGDGLWKKHDPLLLATPEAFKANPSLVWQFYNARRTSALQADPNKAHMALAMLCCPDMLHVLAPQAQFTLITQNIDGLSTRALNDVLEKRGGSESLKTSTIYEMHGRLTDTVCTDCGHKEANHSASLCPALAASRPSSGARDEDVAPDIALENLPRCRRCNGLLRPGIIWFGETPRDIRKIWSAVDEADMCLVIGTSSTVQPAAGFACEVSDRGGKVAIFNTEHTPDSEDIAKVDFLFLGPCEETLPKVLFDFN